MGALGRQATLKAVEGEPVAVTSGDWVDITDENRTGFDVSMSWKRNVHATLVVVAPHMT